MKKHDKDLIRLEAEYLVDHYGMSYGQVSRYIEKEYGWFIHRQTIYRWLN